MFIAQYERFFVSNLGLFSPRRLVGPLCQSEYFNLCYLRYKFCFQLTFLVANILRIQSL